MYNQRVMNCLSISNFLGIGKIMSISLDTFQALFRQFVKIYYQLYKYCKQESIFFLITIKTFDKKIVILLVGNAMVQLIKIVYLVPQNQKEYTFKNINSVYVLKILLITMINVQVILTLAFSQLQAKNNIMGACMDNSSLMVYDINVQDKQIHKLQPVLNAFKIQEIVEYLNQDGRTTSLEQEYYQFTSKPYFTFNGINLELCLECQEASLTNLENINQDMVNKQEPLKSFCVSQISSQSCSKCRFASCKTCTILITGQVCLYCEKFSSLEDGQCTMVAAGQRQENNCISAYYLSSTKECKICSIEDCIYCFEYAVDDLTLTTLYLNFNQFNGDDNIQVGCAMCKKVTQHQHLKSMANANQAQSHNNRQVQKKISYVKDAWVQRIQSFMGSFLPNSYFYPILQYFQRDEIAISCREGYQLVKFKYCAQYCDSNCYDCKVNPADQFLVINADQIIISRIKEYKLMEFVNHANFFVLSVNLELLTKQIKIALIYFKLRKKKNIYLNFFIDIINEFTFNSRYLVSNKTILYFQTNSTQNIGPSITKTKFQISAI
ncbi:unnamed protein product [Paramecium octaurelia]|uniref:Transmembrane protein n=1 Tax=Paramecium octaurelia TaxID=43137 RepID=A0A8S1VJF4_PAROT|nr:unnamed protein product [Paramecium octaurelia]